MARAECARGVQGRAIRALPLGWAALVILLGGGGCSTPERRDARGNFASILSQDLPDGASSEKTDDELDTVETTDSAKLPEAVGADEEDAEPFVELSADAKAAIDEIEKEILAESDAIEADQKEAGPKQRIPMEINRRVREWIYYFSVVDRERFQSFLNRGAYYRPVIESILERNGIPTDLYYLAMIESGFIAHARSRVNAVGFWQFMRPTGREFGLKIGDGVDERRDVLRSTEAGARYLKWLRNRLGSWHLAIAAYNGGPGRVAGAIRRGGSQDFWELARKRALPRETRHYVPKFIAATLVGKNPGKYGFQIEPQGPLGSAFPPVVKHTARPRQSLAQIARQQRVPLSELKALNPHLVAGRTPRYPARYPVWVPAPVAEEELAPPDIHLVRQAAPVRRKARTSRKISRAERLRARTRPTSSRVHIVRRGEGLLSISRRYGVSVHALKRKNRLHSTRILKGQRLLVPKGSS